MTKGLHSVHASATFQSEHAARHMTALCRHFAKKAEATCTQASGRIAFPFGTCDLATDAAQLTLTASANDPARLSQVMDVVTRHLERFAFRENPELEWKTSAQPNPQTSLKE